MVHQLAGTIKSNLYATWSNMSRKKPASSFGIIFIWYHI